MGFSKLKILKVCEQCHNAFRRKTQKQYDEQYLFNKKLIIK